MSEIGVASINPRHNCRDCTMKDNFASGTAPHDPGSTPQLDTHDYVQMSLHLVRFLSAIAVLVAVLVLPPEYKGQGWWIGMSVWMALYVATRFVSRLSRRSSRQLGEDH